MSAMKKTRMIRQKKNQIHSLYVIFFMLGLMWLVIVSPVYAGGKQEHGSHNTKQGGSGSIADIDYLGVAGVMIRDGNYERAVNALEKVNVEDEDTDLSRYYTLSGLAQLRLGKYKQAVTSFENAIAQGQTDAVLNVYLAQAYYQSKEYEKTLGTIDKIKNLNQYSALYSIKAEAEWQSGKKAEAYKTLSRAISLFPSSTEFQKQRIFYLIELDLTQEAAQRSREYLSSLEDDPEAYVTIGEALRRGGAIDLAVHTLETARVRYPGNERVLLALAQAYLSKKMPRIAGRMVEEAAAHNKKLYHDAAEIYRRAKAYSKALYLNSQITDQTKKSKQRFNLLVAMGRYEEALALENRLQQNGVLEDDAIKYALAYALFETRQLERSREYVNQISSADYFRRATQLRRAIETVKSEKYQYF